MHTVNALVYNSLHVLMLFSWLPSHCQIAHSTHSHTQLIDHIFEPIHSNSQKTQVLPAIFQQFKSLLEV